MSFGHCDMSNQGMWGRLCFLHELLYSYNHIKARPRKKVVLRIYKGLMWGWAVGIILILLMFWNMSLNNYTQYLAQPWEKPFCYYSLLKCFKLIVKVNIMLNLLFVFPLALKTVLTVQLKKNMPLESCQQIKESSADTTSGATDSFGLWYNA